VNERLAKRAGAPEVRGHLRRDAREVLLAEQQRIRERLPIKLRTDIVLELASERHESSRSGADVGDVL
jgi:hypothetical protein